MTGSANLKPIAIGKLKNSRCFKGVKSLSVEYMSNKTAWMNNEVFSSYMTELDKTMGKKKHKILFFVDNCSANIPIPPLTWVNVNFCKATQHLNYSHYIKE